MIIEGEDGVTHINVYSKGKTEIGRWLSNFTKTQLLTEHGVFYSVEGYWYWLQTLYEPLRYTHGFEAKNLGKTQDKITNLSEEIFQEKIKSAIDLKLKLRPKDISSINLPLCHYYEYGGKKVDAGYEWIIQHLEIRIKQLKEYYG